MNYKQFKISHSISCTKTEKNNKRISKNVHSINDKAKNQLLVQNKT